MSNKTEDSSMMLVTTSWQNAKTFSLIPTNIDCPYTECIYNPQAKILAIISKIKKDTFHMLPRLDEKGEAIKIKGGQSIKKQRVQQETFTEYYLMERDEIEYLVQKFACNHSDYDYKQYLDAEPAAGMPSMEALTAQMTVETEE